MNWNKPYAFDAEQKRAFHVIARAQLRRLACDLGLPPGSCSLRSDQGHVAVSGEVTPHHDAVYVQVCQPATGYDAGILVRTCRDFTGGPNHFAPLALLDDVAVLGLLVRRVAPGLGGQRSGEHPSVGAGR